ncbi:RNA polymerase sigma factor [Saccharothrix syringae]|uniref:RNA polymerase sigma factor n=1 Tax=Saccharothrix syringae TaxID=103733 RepID=UPI0006893660|nr:sigma-70 region 4 domain-containing protein [Saccharothrix syringae]
MGRRRTAARRLRLVRRVPAEAPVPDHVAERVDDQRRMAVLPAAVEELPRNEREALALCVWSGVSYADAAAVLGIAGVSVRARVSKAKARPTRGLGPPAVTATTSVMPAAMPTEDR